MLLKLNPRNFSKITPHRSPKLSPLRKNNMVLRVTKLFLRKGDYFYNLHYSVFYSACLQKANKKSDFKLKRMFLFLGFTQTGVAHRGVILRIFQNLSNPSFRNVFRCTSDLRMLISHPQKFSTDFIIYYQPYVKSKQTITLLFVQITDMQNTTMTQYL